MNALQIKIRRFLIKQANQETSGLTILFVYKEYIIVWTEFNFIRYSFLPRPYADAYGPLILILS